MNYLISSIYVSTSNPNTVAEPSVISNKPVNIEIVVVLPAPLCPNNAYI